MENQKIEIIENPDLNTEEIFNSSLSNAILYIHLAATTLGLGSQWITGTNHPKVQNKVKQLLKIPEYLRIYDTIALGYPATGSKPRFSKRALISLSARLLKRFDFFTVSVRLNINKYVQKRP